MDYLLDTCVLSECARRNPDGRLKAWLADLDAQIAATALVNGLTVATRNVEDMDHTGVCVVNPFS